MAYTRLHQCALSNEQIIEGAFYLSTPPEGKEVGVPVLNSRFCEVCISTSHGSTVTLVEFDSKLTYHEAAQQLGAPWAGSQEGTHARQKARAITKPIDEVTRRSATESGTISGQGATHHGKEA